MTDPKHTLVVTCLVRDAEGNILLINSPKRGWELPQGRVEEGETLSDAVRREVLEETGIVVEPLTLAGLQSQLAEPSPGLLFFPTTYLPGGTPPLPRRTGEGLVSAGTSP